MSIVIMVARADAATTAATQHHHKNQEKPKISGIVVVRSTEAGESDEHTRF